MPSTKYKTVYVAVITNMYKIEGRMRHVHSGERVFSSRTKMFQAIENYCDTFDKNLESEVMDREPTSKDNWFVIVDPKTFETTHVIEVRERQLNAQF